jgi:hypothetical protein
MSRRLPPTPQTPFILGEVHDIPFRFGREMTPDETIVDVDVQCLSVGTTVDPTPGDSVATPHQVQGTLVLQRFRALLAHGRYVVSVEATLSSGRVFTGEALCFVLPRGRTT